MGIVCKGRAVFRDPQSGQQVSVDADDLDWEWAGSDERQMGAENCYTAECEVQVGGRSHTITWSVYEYPVGAFNYQDVDCGALEQVQDIACHFEEGPDED